MVRSTSKSTGAKTTRASKPRTTPKKQKTSPDQPEVAGRILPADGAPIEHYRGEPDRGERTGGQGSLEEETLDPQAPYNKTYGRKV